MKLTENLNALRAFEAVARLGGYRAAADEIGVTPEAVGQLVRGLEARLGQPLFVRAKGGKGLRPTPAALAAVPALTEAFGAIAAVAIRLRARPGGGALTVSASPSFTAKWLAPRLAGFLDAEPGTDVRLDVTDRLLDLVAGEADVAVRYGRGAWPGLVARRLFPDERLFAALSPALLAARPEFARPEGLAGATLIRDTTIRDAGYPGWGDWFRARGLRLPAAGGRLEVNASVAALDAAARGEGVTLARERLAADDFAAGRLVRLEGDPGLPTGWSYYAVATPEAGPAARRFIAWIEAQAAAG